MTRRPIWLLSVVLAGCVTSGSMAPAMAGDPGEVASALQKAKAPATAPVNATGKPIAFLAASGPGGAKLIAFDLESKKVLWTQPAELTGRVVVSRDVVVATEKGGALVARDVRTGAERWRSAQKAGGLRIGYDADADTVVFVMQRPGRGSGRGEADVVALAAADGTQLWSQTLPTARTGTPAVRGGLVAVPYRSQYVALIDAKSGSVMADILAREESPSFVRSLPEGLFFGGKGIFVAEPETATATIKGSGYLRAELPKFVRPLYHWDGYDARQNDYSAVDRNRVLWRAKVERPRAEFLDNRVYVHNFRFFFALDARKGDLQWVYNIPRVEAVSSEHTGKGIIFATGQGEIGVLDAATGQRTYAASAGRYVLRGATFDAEGFAPTGKVTSPEGEGEEGVAATLASIVWDPDRRFSDVKVFAVDELARQPGKEVTGELLKILEKEGVQPALYNKAADAIVNRKDQEAADVFIKALGQHTDFSAGRKSRGVDVMARALGAMQAKGAAAALASHLRQPDTAPLVVNDIVAALVAMDAKESVPDLRDFVMMYRADPAFAGDPAPLIGAIEALLKLGGPAERELLLYVAEDRRTLESVRIHLRRALAQPDEASAAPAASGK